MCSHEPCHASELSVPRLVPMVALPMVSGRGYGQLSRDRVALGHRPKRERADVWQVLRHSVPVASWQCVAMEECVVPQPHGHGFFMTEVIET